ncbi:MAG: type II secretion system protein [bacterium]|nr:type II secretion system protein [bacterium]
MKKKGFTLVELLAVIAILAILVVIAMPNVLGMFNSSKKNTFKTEVQSILKQVTTDYVQESLSGYNSEYVFANVDLSEIKDSVTNNAIYDADKVHKLNIETTKSYFIKVDNQGNIIGARISDGSFCYNVTGTAIKYADVADSAIKDNAGDTACNYKVDFGA